MPKITFEADMDENHLRLEDGGAALMWQPPFVEAGDVPLDPENGTCVKFWSWDDNKKHESFKRFIGRRVRITVEVASVLDRIVEAIDDDAGHGLGFELGENVRFSCKGGNKTHARWNREADHIRVVGLDVTERQSIKINFFICGSGECYDWVRPDELEKLNVLDKLAEIK